MIDEEARGPPHAHEIAQPFDWNFTRQDLAELLGRLDDRQSQDQSLALAA